MALLQNNVLLAARFILGKAEPVALRKHLHEFRMWKPREPLKESALIHMHNVQARPEQTAASSLSDDSVNHSTAMSPNTGSGF